MFLIHALIITKTEATYLCYVINLTGGPTNTFLKHSSAENFAEDLKTLYYKLIDLGVECRNGQVYLVDLGRTSPRPDIFARAVA